jgi:hypothetical protein
VNGKVSSGIQMKYVDAYVPRTGFVLPRDGNTLGPLGEITSVATQHVTRSRDEYIPTRHPSPPTIDDPVVAAEDKSNDEIRIGPITQARANY